MRMTSPGEAGPLDANGLSTCGSRCAPGGSRTPNLLIRSQMLYPLSYRRWSDIVPTPPRAPDPENPRFDEHASNRIVLVGEPRRQSHDPHATTSRRAMAERAARITAVASLFLGIKTSANPAVESLTNTTDIKMALNE